MPAPLERWLPAGRRSWTPDTQRRRFGAHRVPRYRRRIVTLQRGADMKRLAGAGCVVRHRTELRDH
jgi:hypothetical protein